MPFVSKNHPKWAMFPKKDLSHIHPTKCPWNSCQILPCGIGKSLLHSKTTASLKNHWKHRVIEAWLISGDATFFVLRCLNCTWVPVGFQKTWAGLPSTMTRAYYYFFLLLSFFSIQFFWHHPQPVQFTHLLIFIFLPFLEVPLHFPWKCYT